MNSTSRDATTANLKREVIELKETKERLLLHIDKLNAENAALLKTNGLLVLENNRVRRLKMPRDTSTFQESVPVKIILQKVK